MLITELLDSKHTIKVTIDDSDFYETSTTIGKDEYRFEASIKKENIWKDEDFVPNRWTISFGNYNKEIEDVDYSLTGNGDELKVFSFVKESILMLVKKHKPNAISFTADKEEGKGNRARVYSTMLKKFKLPNYEIHSEGNKYHELYSLVRVDK